MWCDHLPVNTGTRLRTCASIYLVSKSSSGELILEHNSRSCLLKYSPYYCGAHVTFLVILMGQWTLVTIHQFFYIYKINFGGRLKHCLYQCGIKNNSIRCEINVRLRAMIEINIPNTHHTSCYLLQITDVNNQILYKYIISTFELLLDLQLEFNKIL